jgi:predicted signal transduction protein with EAL and GGDEF domain
MRGRVLAIRHEVGLPKHRLDAEVTESALVELLAAIDLLTGKVR